MNGNKLNSLISTGRLRLIIIGLLIIGVFSSAVISEPVDNAKLLFYEWMNGGEPLLVNINIKVPSIDTDACSVIVHRYSTPYNPVKGGIMELIWVDTAKPGSIVKVSDYVRNAPPVKYKVDGSIEYREPQEYKVSVQCYDIIGSRAKLRASGATIVEVRSSKPIADVVVSVDLKEQDVFRPSEVEDTVYCDFGSGDKCTALTKLAVVNSIEGLETAFKLVLSPPSAMYLSSFQQDCVYWDMVTCECYAWSSWYEAGKKLTPTVVAQESVQRSVNGERRVQLGSVEYRLDYYAGTNDGFAGVCYAGPIYTITPVSIRALSYASYLGVYQPGSPVAPAGPTVGFAEISFEDGVYESDYKIGGELSTGISFCYGLGCAYLSVDVYKAGRDDSEYTTPRIVVYDVSGNVSPWFYWWYKDGDPMTYEVEFSR
ncbi:MAG: hypothetical protein F7B18_06135 [Desulfurococcales archaeon]|nr:hypothetical protein [Desulfurococcales archaeon]